MNEYINPRNVESVREALIAGKLKGEFYPTVYVIEITNLCNLKCIICPNKLIKKEDLGYMSYPLFKRVVEDIAPYSEFVMLYWLGESLLHPEIIKMLSIAREKIKGRIVVSSNLTKVNDDILLSLLQNVDIIICSLDRWDPTQYEKIRKGATFHEVVSNIERLIELREPHHKAEIIVKGLDIAFDSKEYKKFQEYWLPKGVYTHLAWLNDWAGTFPDLRKNTSIPIPHSSTRIACADLWFKMVINWRGNIQMCCFDWRYQYPIGKVDQNNWLPSVWHNDKIINLRRSHLNKHYNINKLCESCTTWAEPFEHDAFVDFDKESFSIIF